MIASLGISALHVGNKTNMLCMSAQNMTTLREGKRHVGQYELLGFRFVYTFGRIVTGGIAESYNIK